MAVDTLHGAPLNAEARKWLFYATLRPSVDVDQMWLFDVNHTVAILRRGHVFQLVLPGPGTPLSLPAILTAYTDIPEASIEPLFPVCTLTADERKSWAETHHELKLDPHNDAVPGVLEHAAFVVRLDDESPTSSGERHMQFRINGPHHPFANRWLDKPIQFVVTANGLSAGVCKHAKLDGMMCVDCMKYYATSLSGASIWAFSGVVRFNLMPTAHLTVLLAVYHVDRRTVSPPVRPFIEAAAAVDQDSDMAHICLLFTEALTAHSRSISTASRGRGFVNHMYGLLGILASSEETNESEASLPQIFRCDAWDSTRRGHPDRISRSASCPTKTTRKTLASLGMRVAATWRPGICETTEGVKSYAGYIYLPPGSLVDLGEEQDYPINTFFWFFESRKDPVNSPLSIWMNGGPGSSSLLGLFAENGPCYVNSDSNSTTLSEWAWNNEVNMLYLDQPVQVGLSYDTLQNVTNDLVTGEVIKLNKTDPIPEQNTTLLVGTYPSQNPNQTALGSRNAAIALWHFAQTWFQEFPAYHPNDSRVSIATESYGGRYGPEFSAFFEEQNQKIENGTWSDADGENYIINLDTLILINSCIDRQIQWPSYPQIAYNNTYGIQTVNETIYLAMMDALDREGGCRDQINDCRAVASLSDPDNIGVNETVNAICSAAETFCTTEVRDPYLDYSGRNYYDMASVDPSPFPPSFYNGYLNQPHVQAALGVLLNFSSSSSTVASAFRSIGDYPRPGWIEDLAYLLESGVKVHLMYGDRDFACNWMGGEAVSLAINYTGTERFNAAGYTDIVVNDSYVGGQVRQYGNLSFSRVYEAGHEIPSYQPETAYQMFTRALFNLDIATGTVDTAADPEYATNGKADTWAHKNEDPADLLHYCYIYDTATCTEEQIESVRNGSATIVSGIVQDKNSTQLFPEVFAGVGNFTGSSTSTVIPTATATSTITPTDSGASATPTESSSAVSWQLGAGIQSAGFWTVVAALVQAILV
ncbi:Uu.00g065050.m01.CDS01 [Anthostomella pinea]|uniref:Carboxypeptidase n=1 Tax=Anthostomella pinea TaxID=933095 RepID=A0AAI8YN70_9PEZI|nr:Uu.00g065050.m01.CDS01 [Anthostomella pinea]